MRTAAVIISVSVLAGATGSASVSNLPKAQLDALSGIDVEITPTLIQGAFGADALDDLVALTRTPAEDPGVRLRAYRAMSLYQGARATLIADIQALAVPQGGTQILYLRAEIEALGELRDPLDYPVLIPFLSFEQSRDIRAATADALRIMGAIDAIDALRDRLNTESSAQVRFALSRAVRDLVELLP